MEKIQILYETQEILIIFKPNGFAVQGGQNIVNSVDTVLPKQLGYPIHLVHRLDKETCGLLVVAKNPQAATKWINLIGTKQVKKVYTAICIGKLPKESGTISKPIVTKGISKNAVTHYKVLESFSPDKNNTEIVFSKVQATLETGRMHQIRIHFAEIGCPIAADDKYGNFKQNKQIKKEFGIKKLLLCASSLSFIDNKEITITTPLPDYFNFDNPLTLN